MRQNQQPSWKETAQHWGLAGGLCLLLAAQTLGTDRDSQPKETPTKDAQPAPSRPLADGLAPQDAAAAMTVPPGFQAQLAAGEPQVHQPVALAIDPRGRVWVAEAHTYPTRAPEGEGSDKIIILEDTDHNGTLDKRVVFAEGLNLVSGLELGFGGVWVGAAPYLLFIPDANGDDQPDGPPQVKLDGFGYHDTHETLNGFIWGPDGWLYGCHGVFTHSRVGVPGTPDAKRVPLNAGVWRYHPLRNQFEVFAWGTSNPWGVDFNDHGQAFITACVIPHLFHVIQGGRYQRQAGEHFDRFAFAEIGTIADHAHYAGNIQDHAWWGHEPASIPDATSRAGGGHAHCGAMIYLGDNWPVEYRDRIYFNNVHGNRVNCDLLVPQRSGYVGQHGPDLLLANDHWFRGINLRYGPDGGVYLIDWYDKNACHRVNPLIWDRTNGRVYKITYQGAGVATAGQGAGTRGASVNLGQMSEAELIGLQTHTNDWFVRTARRLLQERGVSAAGRTQLWQQLEGAPNVPQQLRALWCLHATGGLTDGELTKLFRHRAEHLRAWAIQLCLEDQRVTDEQVAGLKELAARDPSPVVRLAIASGLQRLAVEKRWEIATAICSRAEDADDPNIGLVAWYAIEPLVGSDVTRAMKLAATSRLPTISAWIWRRAASDDSTLDQVVAALAAATTPNQRQVFLREILAAFEGRVNIPMPPSWKGAYESLATDADPAIRDQADQIAVILGDRRVFPRLRDTLQNAQTDLARRQRALEILVRGRDPEAAETFQALLDEEPLRGAAIRALAAYDNPRTPTLLLSKYAGLPDAEKRDAIGTLTTRPSFAFALLDAVQQGTVPRTDLHAYHIRQLTGFNQPELAKRIQEAWGDIRATSADKQQQIATWKKQLTPNRLRRADLSNGRRIFEKTCATCHTLFGVGNKVGPDITGSNRANLDYLLENVIDPSAVLGKDYRMSILVCADGRIVQGLVQKETDSALTVRTINDTVVIAKADIDERQLSEQSLMPEKLLESLQADEVRDLAGYLASPTQVPLRGPRAPIDPGTGKVPGAVEGEALKVVATTGGTAAPQGMSGFAADAWSGANQLWWTGGKPGDRLSLEVPVPKAGSYAVELVLTRARDYGIVQVTLANQPLGAPIDLYNSPEVVTTGVLEFPAIDLPAGPQTLVLELRGANPADRKSVV